MTEFLAFARRPNERIGEFLSRYEIVRQRAAVDGQFRMTAQGNALQVLRALDTSPTELIVLPQPFAGRYPGNEQELGQLFQVLRRQRHISEGNQETLRLH